MSIQRYDILHPKMRDKGRFILYADHIADKDADLHNLLSTIADIRAALGVGGKPMLSELAGIVREVREQADRDERAACKALADRDVAISRAERAEESLEDINLRNLAARMHAALGLLKRQGCYHPAMDSMREEGFRFGLNIGDKGEENHISQPGKMVGSAVSKMETTDLRQKVRRLVEIMRGLVSHLELCRDMDFPGDSEEDKAVLASVNAILEEARAALAEMEQKS